MPYLTDERLKNYLDTNQLYREQMCLAILSVDKRFSDVHPRHPRGGRDGGRDIEATYKEDQVAFAAIGFVNQANDSKNQKRTIQAKFKKDLKRAISTDKRPYVFIFFTNINLTIKEKEILITEAKKYDISYCDIFDRERIRIILDSADGMSIRFQYLNIPLSETEQATFFAKWGDDIQSIIATGFQRIERTLDRVLFLQESADILKNLTILFELNKKYRAENIGHFRLFCSLYIKGPKNNVISILFGSSDRSDRMSTSASNHKDKIVGIKYGICGGQWLQHFDNKEAQDESSMQDDEDNEKYKLDGSFTAIGADEVLYIPISYRNDHLFIVPPYFVMKDIDESMFLPFMNHKLAKIIKSIHVYSNGYKIQEIPNQEIYIDDSQFEPNTPLSFNNTELNDPWVRLRPKGSSCFHIRFFELTPKRMLVPEVVKDSLKR